MTREDAIKIVRNIYQTDAEKEALATLIPELVEKVSEEEKMRREMVGFVRLMKRKIAAGMNDIAIRKEDDAMFDRWLAWLEKQKEQKPVECSEDFTENIRTLLNGKLTRHSEDGSMSSTVFIDDKTLKDIVTGIWFYVGKEALKYPNKEINVAEWSERDDKCLASVISHVADSECFDHFHDITKEDIITWLKSLRSRPKASGNWKPSEEQMDALDEYIWAKEPNKNKAMCVISLYEDLKKLI